MLAEISWLGWLWIIIAAVLAYGTNKGKLTLTTLGLFLIIWGLGWMVWSLVYATLWLIWYCLPLIVLGGILWFLHRKFGRI